MLVGEGLFAALTVAAMRLYPGGTWFDSGRVGHAFWQNYLCDVARQPSLGGQPNPGSVLASAGLIVQAVTLLPLWLAMRELCSPASRLRPVIAGLSIAAALGAVAVPTAALAGVDELHAPLILLSAALAIGATTTALLGIMGEPRTGWLLGLGAAVVAATLGDLALFVQETWLGGGPSKLAPAIQKIAALLLVIWATLAALRALASPQPPQRSRCTRAAS